MEESRPRGHEVEDCWNHAGVWGSRGCSELERTLHCVNCEVYSRAGRLLLDRACSEGYQEERTELLAAEGEKQREGDISLLIFRVGKEWFALPTEFFLEVLEPRPVHHLPHRSGAVLNGLVNVRGELQICVSMSALLEVETNAEDRDDNRVPAGEPMLFVRSSSGNLVFPVSEVFGTHRYDSAELRPAPATLAKAASNYTQGVLPWKDTHIAVLEEGPLFERIARSLQ